MKKVLLIASLFALTPAFAANTYKKTNENHTKKSAKQYDSHLPKPRYIPEDHLPQHLQYSDLESLTNLNNTPTEAAKEDEKSNSASLGILGDLSLKSQDRSDDFRKSGYTKPSIGVIQISAKARLVDWINLDAAGSYSQFTDTDSSTNYVKLEEAYTTIGNFYKTPFYLSIGYQYLPFGVYTPYSITGNVTKQMAEAQNNIIGFGYEKRHYYTMVYFYGNQGHVNNQSRQIAPVAENFGAEAGIVQHSENSGLHVNASYLNNYREASLVSNLNPRNLSRVGAMSAHADYYYGYFGILGDFTFTTGAFNTAALNYNGRGAAPKSLFAQAYIRFHSGKLPSVFGVGYGRSWQALALQLPLYRIVTNYSLLLSRYFSVQLQYTHAGDYGTNDAGQMNRDNTVATITGTGRTANAYEARLSFAFGNERPDMYSELEEEQ